MTKNKTIYLKDYKVSNFLIEKTHLDFEIFDDYTLVTSEIIFFKNPESKEDNTLKLHGNNLELQEIYLDGEDIFSDLENKTRGSFDSQ